MNIEIEINDVEEYSEENSEECVETLIWTSLKNLKSLKNLMVSNKKINYQIDHYYLLNMLEDSNLAFIASFVTTFISKYVVNSGGVILLKFINEVLAHFEQSFHLPLSLSGFNSITGINLLTRDLYCYVACSECNSIYFESASVP
ncbi:hypothetical protein PHYBLDRAFT_59501 [Phycomyces blakesleeanus NRRL 1555(-)]|uniref:Uncharacterized protein n=1 Tax=Phycomyces blakesleeanus (strain ATCC 8743b / DSM 1359 / FGSC 10004 / NBRC 33097 / NRRL 1555) TaxID=763407 RepID=A0A167NIA3_PHYB8|nr:hypothetical protein PHYBLDRAFT_59501 [Phycomyces blakesleeanus NRRL 1555(-)]OAD75970.1 hypothetical protein PHYBLDRAFT_59501 [Phycomyces blakesleeanus NRRL 1555(-)]|eukprot:XP_018294010.1 hypothetical protein PHYBLDRAFT_59501 [Phycomyces blakesleeanus NRRL 1555(-)]